MGCLATSSKEMVGLADQADQLYESVPVGARLPTLSLKRARQSRGGFRIFVYNGKWLRRRIGQRRGATRAPPGIRELIGLSHHEAGRFFFSLKSSTVLSFISLWFLGDKPYRSANI